MVNISFDTATAALGAEMITDAESVVNRYLSRRYDLGSAYFQTATSIPPLVRTLTTRLSEGYMWKAMSRGAKESIARGNELEKSVLSELQLLSEYKGELVNTAGSVIDDMSNTATES